MNRFFGKALNLLRNGEFSNAVKKYLIKRGRYYTYQVSGPLTQQNIVRTLRDLELMNGDVVCVQSSFSSLGYVDGGPATFINALEETVLIFLKGMTQSEMFTTGVS